MSLRTGTCQRMNTCQPAQVGRRPGLPSESSNIVMRNERASCVEGAADRSYHRVHVLRFVVVPVLSECLIILADLTGNYRLLKHHVDEYFSRAARPVNRGISHRGYEDVGSLEVCL